MNSEKSVLNWLLNAVGLMMLMIVYYGSLLFIILLVFGNNTIRLIVVLIYLYQLFLSQKSALYKNLCIKLQGHNYFPANGTIFEDEISERNNMISLHPHGVMAITLGLNDIRNPQLKNFRFLVSRGIFSIPIGGLFGRWFGLEGVNNENFKALIQKGENLCFLPGGFEEATITDPKQDKVFIKSRKGFIKYGLEYGYKVYPSYTFNENKMFSCFTKFEKLRLTLNKFKLPAVLFWGRYGLFPRFDIKLFTVVGKKIELPKIDQPTKEDVEKFHKIYVDSLRDLYYRYKDKFGGSPELEIY